MNMNLQILTEISGLALLDSLNPFTVAAMAYLLGTPKSFARSFAFISGTYVVYFLGGVLLLQGLLALIRNLLPRLPPWSLGVAELTLSIALVAGAVWTWRKASSGTPFKPPENLSVPATLAFATVSTVSDLPSGIPYFGAISCISVSAPSLLGEIGYLSWYNLLYVGPLLTMLLAHVSLSPERSQALFGRVREVIDWAFAKLVPSALGLGALFLVYDGVRRLIG
jgi:hypothetical protein